ncbi:hypothetical protein K8942_00660 [Candidatus Peribacteria bacterium]|nr:MAG: hypothetical protein K8942_00660 [Candidatus Peribacteria bacterium]
MLRKPKPLPQRFNRTVTPQTRRLVQRRHTERRKYKWQRWKRAMQQWQRKLARLRPFLTRILAGCVVAVLILIVCLALFSPILDVREIVVARSDPRLNSVLIQDAIRPLFGRRLPLLSVEEIPSLLTTELPDMHRSAVPDLATVTIRKDYPSSLQIRLTLRPLAYRLSIETTGQTTAPVTPSAASGSDFLTKDGLYVSYTAAQAGSGTMLPQLTIVDWGVKPDPWKPLVGADVLSAMQKTEAALATDFTQTVRSRTVYLRAREYHLQTESLMLWFDMKSPIEEQLARYRLFLDTVPAGTAKQYVDLRITGKLIYR